MSVSKEGTLHFWSMDLMHPQKTLSVSEQILPRLCETMSFERINDIVENITISTHLGENTPVLIRLILLSFLS